jgi:hypothetical protein
MLVWLGWQWLQRNERPLVAGHAVRDIRQLTGPALAYGVAALVPIGLIALWMAAIGAFPAFWDASFAYNVGQAAASPLEILRGFARGSWQVFKGSSALLWLLALAGGFMGLSRAASPLHQLVVVWALADLAGLFLGGSKFAQVHFIQLVPSFAMLAGFGLERAWRASRAVVWGRLYLLLALGAVGMLANQLQIDVTLRANNERVPPRASVPAEQVVAFQVRAQPMFQRDRTIFVWGDASQLYVLADGHSPSRFFHGFPLSQVFDKGDGYLSRRAELLSTFERQPPSIIAIDPATVHYDPDGRLGFSLSGFPELEQLIAHRYTALGSATGTGGWRVYTLNG